MMHQKVTGWLARSRVSGQILSESTLLVQHAVPQLFVSPASSTYHHINETETQNIVAAFTACQCWPKGQFHECSKSNPTLIVLRKHLDIDQFSFSLFFVGHHHSANLVWLRYPSARLQNNIKFYWSPSVGKPRNTVVAFVKNTESCVKMTDSYEFCPLIHHLDIKFAGTDRNGPNYRIGPN